MKEISFDKITELLKTAKSLISDPETNPTVGLRDDILVLWVFYGELVWSITLDDFDFDNIQNEIIKSKEEIKKWIEENPTEIEKLRNRE